MTQVTDPDGRVTAIGYYNDQTGEAGFTPPSGVFDYVPAVEPKAGHVKSIDEGGLETTQFTYDLSGFNDGAGGSGGGTMTTTVTNGLGQATVYTIGTEGEPETVTDACGQATHITWDMGNVVKSERDRPAGPPHRLRPRHQRQRHEHRRIGHVLSPGRRRHHPHVRPEMEQAGLRDHPGRRGYDLHPQTGHRRGPYEDPDERRRPARPDRTLRLRAAWATCSRKQDAMAHSTAYGAYDALGNAGLITGPLGNTVTRVYDPMGRKIRESSSQGRTETWAYDGLDRVIDHHVVDGRGATDAFDETWQYSPAGLLVTHADSTGLSETYTYDAAGRKTKKVVETGSDSYTTTWTYDAAGRVIERIDPDGSDHTFTYDACGRLLEEDVSGKLLKKMTYDAAGNVLTQTDYRNQKTSFTYDNLYRKIEETGPAVQNPSDPNNTVHPIQQWTYDPMGRITSTTDPMGNTHTYKYDGLKRVAEEDLPQGHKILRAFDLLDHPTRVDKEPQGLVVDRDYDALGRVTKETQTYPSGAGTVTATTTTQYNDNAGTMTVTDPLGHVSVTQLDSLGHVKSVTVDPSGLGLTRAFHYNGHGKVVKNTDPNGHTTTTAWDGLDRKTRVNIPGLKVDGGGTGTATISWTYDFAGRVLTATDPRGVVTAHTYDTFGRELTRTVAGEQVGAWAYDDTANGTSAPAVVETDGRGNPIKHYLDGLGREDKDHRPGGPRHARRLRPGRAEGAGHRPAEPCPDNGLRRPGPPDRHHLGRRRNGLGPRFVRKHRLRRRRAHGHHHRPRRPASRQDLRRRRSGTLRDPHRRRAQRHAQNHGLRPRRQRDGAHRRQRPHHAVRLRRRRAEGYPDGPRRQ